MGCSIHGQIEAEFSVERKERRRIAYQEMWDNMDEERRKKYPNWMEVCMSNNPVKIQWNAVVDIRNIVSRNYDFFATVFGVRRDRPEEDYGFSAPYESRGYPSNISGDTKRQLDEEGGDAHSISYMTLKEFKNIPWNLCQGRIAEFCMDHEYTRLLKIMEVFSDGTDENVRMIVWFDN